MTWLDTQFANHFCDPDGVLIAMTSPQMPITTRQMLKTEDIGYQYDRRAEPVAISLADVSEMAHFSSPVAHLANASFEGGVAAFQTTSIPAISDRVSELVDRNEPVTVRLRLNGVKLPDNLDVALQVHINCLKASKDTPITDASYVTSVTFFHGKHGEHDGHVGDGTTSFLIDATPALAQLYGDRPFKDDEPIKVTLIAKPLFPDAANPWEGEVEELSPKQVSIEVVGRKA